MTTSEASDPTKSKKDDEYPKKKEKGQAMVFWAKLFTCEMTDDTEISKICKLLQFQCVTFNKLMSDFRR
jgi:hypothetical protein